MKLKNELLTKTAKVGKTVAPYIAPAAMLVLAATPALADGLDQAEEGLKSFKEFAWLVAPILASILGVVTWIRWMAGHIQGEQLQKWVIGLVGLATVGGLVGAFVSKGAA